MPSLLLSRVSLTSTQVLPSLATRPSPADRTVKYFYGNQETGKPWKVASAGQLGMGQRHCGRVDTDWI